MKIIILFQFLFISVITFPQITFQKTFGGELEEKGNAIQQTFEGGFIIAGSTKSYGYGSSDFYIIRIDQYGDTLWTKTYGGTGYEFANNIFQTQDDGFIIEGFTTSFGASDGGIYLVKTNEFGDTLWTKTIGTADAFIPEKMIKTSDGGYIICGRTEQWSSNYKFSLAKINVNGDTTWTKAYEYGIAESIQQTSDGGYILVVYPYAPPSIRLDIMLVKTNEVGELTWTKFYGGTEADVGFAVQQTSDNGYILAGRTDSFGAGASDFFLLKTDSNGDSLWMKTYGGIYDERAFALEKTSDGGFIIAGYTATFGAGYFDFYLVRTDEYGDTLWTRTHGGSWQEEVSDIMQTSDEGYAAVGYTYSFGSGSSSNIYFVKTDQLGMITGISDPDYNYDSDFHIFQNYPNPFNPSTIISWQLPVSSNVTLKIYDVLGNEVATIVNEELTAGKHEAVFDAAHYSSGIYFYEIQAGEFIETKKMLLVK